MMKKNNAVLGRNTWFFDLWASSYDFAPFQFWMKRFHKPVLKELAPAKMKILDLSCGSGELLKEIQVRFPKAELYGVDISAKMLEIARTKLSGRKVILQKMDVHALQYPSNYFDFVFSTEAFHHYYDQQKAVEEMKRVVKERGKVMIVDINFFWSVIHRIFERIEPGCVRIKSKREMRDLFRGVGLREVSQERSFLFSVATVGIK
ncbi:class I SAM-dependent methyltransferase [Candidatus Woesearchaeota archaeon]|nr:class I SAM-dependent methyltransferase [Candidatus Woesearchaeota archaeon]